MSYAATTTRTATETVAATAARVAAVLRQVRVDFINASGAGLTSPTTVESWNEDLAYMLAHNALEYFELRIGPDNNRWRSWRYEVSNDGTLRETSLGGGINFFGAPSGLQARLVIKRRPNLPSDVSAEIDQRGWTTPVESLSGSGTRERAYSKDEWGVIRHRFDG